MTAHRALRPVLWLVSLMALLLPATAMTAQGSQTALLSEAFERLDRAESLTFSFDITFFMTGRPGDYGEIELTGSGIIHAGADRSLELVVDGQSDWLGETTPIAVELRIVDQILYYQTGEMPQFAGAPLGELALLFQQQLTASLQSNVSGEGSGQTGAAAQTALDNLIEHLMAIDLTSFTTTTRLADIRLEGEAMAHFRTTLAVDELLRSQQMMDVLVSIVAISDPQTAETIGPAEAELARTRLEQAVSAALTVDYYVNGATGELYRIEPAVDLLFDPAAMDREGDAISLKLNAGLTMKDYDAAPPVVAPANAVVADAGSLLGDNTPETPAATPAFAFPTSTPLAADVPTVTDAQAISANIPMQVRLSAAGPTDLIYTSPGDETINVVVRSLEEPGTVDTTLEILTATGTRLAYNDDHGGNRSELALFDSAIEALQLSAPSSYTIRVTSFSGAAEGNVEVLVESDAAPTPSQPTAVPGQTMGSVERVTGNVPANGQYTFEFDGTAGEIITLTVRATGPSDFDPRVTLYGPNGALVAQNDDHGEDDPTLGRFDSRLSELVLPATGTYSAVISGFAGMGGPFELELELAGAESTRPQPTAVPTGTPTEERVIYDRIESNDFYLTRIEVNAGDVYTLTVRAIDGDLDPQLYVYDWEDNLVAVNDDHGTIDRSIGQLDSRIQNLIFRETGTYEIEIHGYGDTSGGFALVITPVATGAPTGSGIDEVTTGTLESEGSYTTTFEAQAGDYVSVAVRALSGDLDPAVTVYDPDGFVIAFNDDHQTLDSTLGQFDAKTQTLLIDQTGTYTIEVTGYLDTAGMFAITTTIIR